MAGRVKIAQFVFLCMLALIGLRAFYLQVISPDEIIAQAHKRFDHAIKLSPNRGTIYDRVGQPLAISLEVKSIAANPRLIKDPARTARKLSKILDLNASSLQKKLKENRYFVWIKRHATPDEVAAVRALEIKGIGYYDEAKRFYPESESLANVLGFVGIDGQGLEGLELMFDTTLKGKQRQIEVHKDGLGRIIYARGLPPDEAKDGHTLWLTLDRRIQYIAYNELKKAVSQHSAQSGFIIITNPLTGEIYAIVSYPGFDPNQGSYTHLTGHKNRAVVDVFEPGSVIKPMWVSWGLENRLFKPSQIIFCENGKYTIHRTTIHDHEKYGWLPVRDIIKFSSNIGMAKLMDTISSADMYSCMKHFGLITPTGLDFPGEPASLVRDPGSWTSVDKTTMAFGHGFAVTGIQLITSFNSMINGGMLLKPYLVDHITDATGKEIQCFRPTIIRKVVSRDVSDEILGILKSVALKGGTAEAAGMNAFQVFGKTGTAQKIDPLTGTYSKHEYISTFIGGIVDATGKPRLSMIVTINEPHPYYYASIVSCPVFKEIVSKCASILDLSPNITLANRGGNG
ncbi:MAG: peptidoglycan D,D-transpeptidase FtsI family protein [Desulfomonilia bacterium]